MLRLLIAAVLVFAAGVASAERRVALIIGVDDYKTIRKLDNAVEDAQAIEATLEALDFEVTLETDRNLKRLRRALQDFQEDAAGADVALVYYAGHGVEISGENRLLPIDADASSLDTLKASTLPLEDLRAVVADVSKVGLIILDACRNDPFGAQAASGTAGETSSRGAMSIAEVTEVKPGLGRIGRAEGILFAFSAAPGETASDGADGHSPFAAALVKYLGTEGVEIRSVLTLVQQEVYDKSRGRQLPYVENGLPKLFFAAQSTDALPERERLLLAMADVTLDLRAEVEAIAAENDMPLAPLYAAMIASDIANSGKAERSAKLHEAATAFVKVRGEMRALASDDPQVAKLRGEAEEQLGLGAFETARAKLAAAAAIDSASRKSLKANFVTRTLSEATTHYLSGDTARASLDYQQAIAAYTKAIEVFSDLGDGDILGEDLDRRILTYENIGELSTATGDLAAARQAFDMRLRFSEQRAASDPANLFWLRDASVSYVKQGDVLAMVGDLAAAKGFFEKALTATDRLVVADPKNTAWQRDLSVSHERLGKLMLALDDRPGALKAFEAALAIRKALAETEPGDPEWQRLLSMTYNDIGDIRYAAKDMAAALVEYQAGLEITRRLAEESPASVDYLRALMISQTLVGDVQLTTGDLDAAHASYEAALKGARRIADNNPGDAGYRRDLSVSITKLGDVEFSRGNIRQAAEAFREGLVITEALSVSDPANVVWLRDLIIAHYSLAMAGDEPLVHFRRALQVAEMMQADGRLAPADAYIPGALRDALAKAEADPN